MQSNDIQAFGHSGVQGATTRPARAVEGSRHLASISPVDGRILGRFQVAEPETVRALHTELRARATEWADHPVRERIAALRSLREVLACRAEELAETIAREVGKPLVEVYGAEILPTLHALRWLEANAARVLAPERLRRRPRRTQTWEPYGVIGFLSPWNFPLFLTLPVIAAALVAGNGVLWKPSDLALASSEVLRDVLEEAGLGDRVGMALGGPATGEAVVEAGCDKYVLIGSARTGRAVLERLGRQLRPAVAELSGIDPMVVLADADVDLAARAAVWARLTGAGQTCMSPRRIYVERPVYRRFLHRVREELQAVRVGDPLDPSTEVGPIRTEPMLQTALAAIEEAVDWGATLVCGGDRCTGPGTYLTPTLLADCDETMRVFREEVCAPVLAVAPLGDADTIGERVRDGPYALTASVWSRDRERARRIATALPGGVVSINDVIVPAADPTVTFGGQGSSGYGTLRGAAGLREMVRPRALDEGPGDRSPRRHLFPYRAATLDILRAQVGLVNSTGWGKWGPLKEMVRAVARYRRTEE